MIWNRTPQPACYTEQEMQARLVKVERIVKILHYASIAVAAVIILLVAHLFTRA